MSDLAPGLHKEVREKLRETNLDFEQGRFDLALIGYGQALTLLPDNPNILFDLALTRLRLGDLDGAARDVCAVVDLEAPNVGEDVWDLAETIVRHAKEGEGDYAAHELAMRLHSKLGEQGLGNCGLIAEVILMPRDPPPLRVKRSEPPLRGLEHVSPVRPEPVLGPRPSLDKPRPEKGPSSDPPTKGEPSTERPTLRDIPPEVDHRGKGPEGALPKPEETTEEFTADGELKSVKVLRPDLRFDDVVGMASEKRYLRAHVLLPLRRPDMFSKYGLRRTANVLLFGPPGVGKSHLVLALAGEAQVGLISVRIDAILNKYTGTAEKNLHKVFDEARKHAPCILLVDELDGLGISREDTATSGSPSYALLVNQFLIEMDELARSDAPVFVIGTSNRPWQIDPALRRSGRFTDLLYVGPPEPEERSGLFGRYTEGAPREVIDWRSLALETEGFSGADIAAICRDAKIRAIESADEEGKEEVPLSLKILRMATAEHVNAGRAVREWYHRVLEGAAEARLRDSIPDRERARLIADAKRFQEPRRPTIYHPMIATS